MKYRGLFIGLTTLDFIYGVSHLPHSNEKQAADAFETAAGGPATNAAVTFQNLGNQAVLLSAVGQHQLSALIKADLVAQRVQLVDLSPEYIDLPTLSSILVTQSTGERAVVYQKATNLKNGANRNSNPDQFNAEAYLEESDIVLLDGHQLEVSLKIAQQAYRKKIPTVLDGGSWKTGLEDLLPWINYAICSADFFPSNCTMVTEVIQYMSSAMDAQNVNKLSCGIAITQGEKPVQYLYEGKAGEVNVPSIETVDTLGAGDTFHGAFCNAILQNHFVDAIQQSAIVASASCQSFGTRQWLKTLKPAYQIDQSVNASNVSKQ